MLVRDSSAPARRVDVNKIEAPGRHGSTKIRAAQGASMLAYPAVLDLSPSTRDLLARMIRQRRKAIGSRWRKATPGRQALLVLVHLRTRASYAESAAGFGLGVATVYRYVTEAVDLLAGLAAVGRAGRLPDRDAA